MEGREGVMKGEAGGREEEGMSDRRKGCVREEGRRYKLTGGYE